jgi:hypothetical protein
MHTPGPWHGSSWLDPRDAIRIYTIWGNGGAVAQLTAGTHGADDDSGVRAANAKLIAAAPDLFERACDVIEVLEEMAERGELPGSMPARVKKLRAAIAKAQG